jgi:hypothetical protein
VAVLSVELNVPANEIEMISAVEVDMAWQRREGLSRIMARFGESSSVTHHGRTFRSVVGKLNSDEAETAEQVLFIEWDSGLAEQDREKADRLIEKDLQRSLSKQETTQLDELITRAVLI